MNKRIWILLLVLVLGLGLSNGFAADDKMEAMMKDKTTDKSATMMDDAKMQEMMKLSAPGENHKQLEPLVGTWNHTSKWWMSADAPAEESKGTSVNSLILDGRFVKQEFKGQAMGKPFEGLGFFGYDNIKGEYTSIWLDNMATGIFTMSGTYSAATKTLSMSGHNSCPMTGEKARSMRWDWTMTDNDHSTFANYMPGPDGKEYKAMEIVYTRSA